MPNNWGELADTSWYDPVLNEFTISTAEELAGLASLSMMETISMEDYKLRSRYRSQNIEWIPIGRFKDADWSDTRWFGGVFDGKDIPSRALELQIIQYPKLVCLVMYDWVTTPRLV